MVLNYTHIAQHLKFLIFSIFIFSTTISLPVLGQSLTVVTPNGGEVWTYGQTETLTWSGQNLSSSLGIELSYDGGIYWNYIGDVPSGPNGGNASIFVNYYSTQNALIKFTDLINPGASDQSDQPFTIVVPAISIYVNYTGAPVFADDLTLVQWNLNTPGITLLNAEISIDNGQTFVPVAQNINALNSYTYLMLSDTPSDSCILRLYNAEDPSESGESAVFEVLPKPLYNITSPTSGELVNANSLYIITWNVENPYSEYCYLEYSSDNGQSWTVIDNGYNTGTSGSYTWVTPDLNSEQCLIRISDSYALSSRDTSAVFSVFPFPETPVCMVTVDSLTNYNLIIWEKPDTDLITNFLVYKESDEANIYTVIDTVGYNEEPVVTDFGSNPAIRPYRYKIGFMDSENRVFPAGDFHQTIHLTINQGVSGNWNLIWTPYLGFDYNSYKIMRRSGNGAFEQIATVSASFSSFTDLNAPAGDISYMVKIVNPDGCNTGLRNAVYTDVYSNQASASLVSAGDISKSGFSIYPVPANDRINIQFGDNAKGTINLTITDVTGRIIYSEDYSDIQKGQVKSVNSSNLNEGMYLVNVISSGYRITKKIVVRH